MMGDVFGVVEVDIFRRIYIAQLVKIAAVSVVTLAIGQLPVRLKYQATRMRRALNLATREVLKKERKSPIFLTPPSNYKED